MKVVIRKTFNILLQAKNGRFVTNSENKFMQYITEMFLHGVRIRHESKILSADSKPDKELEKMMDFMQHRAGEVVLEFEIAHEAKPCSGNIVYAGEDKYISI